MWYPSKKTMSTHEVRGSTKISEFFLFKKAFEWNHSGPEVHFMILNPLSRFLFNFESRGGQFTRWKIRHPSSLRHEALQHRAWGGEIEKSMDFLSIEKKKPAVFFRWVLIHPIFFLGGNFDAGFWFLGMMKKQFWQRYIMYVNNILYTLNRWVGGFTDFICINSRDTRPTRYQNPHSQLQTHRENWQNLDWRYTAGQPENLDKSKRCYNSMVVVMVFLWLFLQWMFFFLHFAWNLQLPSRET